MKKYQGLGRSLSKEELKKISGGLTDPNLCQDECNVNSDCSTGYECQLKECSYHVSANKCVFIKP